MDDSEKNLAPSTHSRSSTPRRSSSGGFNSGENEVGSKLSKPKTPTTKNFMSPTISAASKAVVPSKKILAERNETPGWVSPNTHLQKPLIHDQKPYVHEQKPLVHDSRMVTPKAHVQKPMVVDSTTPPPSVKYDGSDSSFCRVSTLLSKASEWDDNEGDSQDDHFTRRQPYDPLTNYLSPRPKFLRYKPYRRREMLVGRERKYRDENDDGLIHPNMIVPSEPQKPFDEEEARNPSSDSSSPESSEKQESDDSNGGKDVEGLDSNSSLESFSEEGTAKEGGNQTNGGQSDDSGTADKVEKDAGASADKVEVEEGTEQKEGGEEHEEEEEFDEVQESCGSLKGLLKFVLVVASLLFFISYMASMNSPTSSPAPIAVQDYMHLPSQGVRFLGEQVDEESSGFLELQHRSAYEDLGHEQTVEIEVEEKDWETDEMTDIEKEAEAEAVDVCDFSMERPRELPKVEAAPNFESLQDPQSSLGNGEKGESVQVQSEVMEYNDVLEPQDGECGELSEQEVSKPVVEISDEMGANMELIELDTHILEFPKVEAAPNFESLQDPQSSLGNGEEGERVQVQSEVMEYNDVLEPQDGECGELSEQEVSEQVVGVSDEMGANMELIELDTHILEFPKVEAAPSLESLQDPQSSSENGEEGERIQVQSEVMVYNDVLEPQDGKCGELSEQELEKPVVEVFDVMDSEFLQYPRNSNPDFVDGHDENVPESTESHFEDNSVVVENIIELGFGAEDWTEEVTDMNVGIVRRLVENEKAPLILLASIFSAIVSVVLGFCIWRRSAPKKSSVVQTRCEEESQTREDYIERAESMSNSSMSLMRSVENARREAYESRLPTVELLGEYVLPEVSSSLRSCRMKDKMAMDEESKFSTSQGEILRNKAYSVPVQMQQSPSECSSMDSPSYGSFTTHKVIVKKERGRDGDGMKEVTTPVRRSSRIQSRVM